MAAEFTVSEDHPLALELTSLRTAVLRYQREAHTASVKLQRHSLDTTHALEGARLLEQENQRLSDEVITLRANPDITPHPASLQVPELTLALRKLSDKLTFTEDTLLTRTTELATARSAFTQAHLETENAKSLAARARAREEEGRTRERELERKARAADEERKMADLVVQEYADLVRSLEGRPKGPRPSVQVTREASSSSVTLVESLAEGKTGLQKLLEEFNGESERLAADMSQLQIKLDSLNATLESERKSAGDVRSQLASALAEIDKYHADDNTAVKMVSRYMKFSQSTTDSLQKAMENFRTRHASTTGTLESQVDSLRKSLLFERRQSETLRRALDELSEDISRESYGRRREISLRLALLGREEGLAENLRRWIRKSKESFNRVLSKTPLPADNTPLAESFERIIQDAERLLESLNGQPSSDEEIASGSVARVLAAQDAVSTLTRELHHETSRRLDAERRLAQLESTEGHPGLDGDTRTPDDLHETTKSNGNALELSRLPPRTTSLPTSSHEHFTLESSPVEVPSPAQRDEQEQPTSVASSSLSLPEQSDTASSAISPISPNMLDIRQLNNVAASDPSSPDHNHAVPVQELPTTEDDQERHSHSSVEDASTLDEPEPTNDIAGTRAAGRDTDGETPSVPLASSTEVVSLPIDPHKGLPEIIVAPADPTAIQHDSEDFISAVNDITLSKPSIEPLSQETSPTASAEFSFVDPHHETTHDVTPHNVVLVTQSSVDPPAVLQAGASPISDTNAQQRLLADLLTTQHRYDGVQRSFRDCDLALKDLKKDIAGLPDTLEMTSVMQTAVERLNDFNEDARVELEIRVSDEERIYTGYTTLLSISGAISEEVDVNELETEIQAFVSGTDKAVAKAMRQLTRKLDDLQHDIACVKRTVHELASFAEDEAVSPAASPSGWSSWTGGLLGSPRPSSPAPSTFGSVMTSPRLRHSSSLSHMNSQRSLNDSDGASPFASLGLRIPMPAHVIPRYPASLAAARPTARPRVSSASAMYLLGLGARSSSFGSGGAIPQRPKPQSPRVARKMSEEDTIESDVE